jgi:plastocyanin
MMRPICLCGFLGLLLALTVPAAGTGRPVEKVQGTSRHFEVRMVAGNKFDAQDIEIQAGDTVTWINASMAKHTATADDDSELKFTEVVLDSGKFSTRVTFPTKGKVKYHCKIHGPSMSGTITVK